MDDQAIIGEAIRRTLARHETIAFQYCADPAEALDVAASFEPTVILVDLIMPEIDGLELVRRFRAHPTTRNVPLIVLSTREEPETKAEAFAVGANDYLVKLPDAIELVARIRHHSRGYIHRLQRDEAYEALIASQKMLRDDLDQAARYVESLLPAPMTGRVHTAWRFVPSASLGGDTFGYHWIDADRFAVYLLDVSGHGVGAALLAVSVLNILRSQSLPRTRFDDPGEVLGRLSESFRTETQSGKYFTIWYGVYDGRTRTLCWSGGGHPPAVVFEADAFHLLPSSGPMPGILPDLTFETRERQLPPGARLLLFSDGLYEIEQGDGEIWDHAGFVGLLAGMAAERRLELDRIIDAVRTRQGRLDFDDDLSLLQVTFP